MHKPYNWALNCAPNEIVLGLFRIWFLLIIISNCYWKRTCKHWAFVYLNHICVKGMHAWKCIYFTDEYHGNGRYLKFRAVMNNKLRVHSFHFSGTHLKKKKELGWCTDWFSKLPRRCSAGVLVFSLLRARRWGAPNNLLMPARPCSISISVSLMLV